MKLIPAIIFTAIALSLGAATSYAQEPTETPTVTPTATATPEPTPTPNGSITVCADADTRHWFTFDTYESRGAESIPDVTLRSDRCETYEDLDDGRYRFVAREADGFDLRRVSIRGTDAGIYTSAGVRDREATIDLRAGHSYRVTFVFEEAPDATPEPTATPTRVAVVAPTNEPGLALCESGTIIQVPRIAACPASTSTPVATPVVPTIRPPSTGDGGLR